jgi:ubiquinone/menaquinone biosynthesis C-methylase UbiE
MTAWAEKLLLNNFIWVLVQRMSILPVWSESMELPAGATILEVGCGRGAGSVILVDWFKPSRVDAFDVDEDMIRKAGEYLPEDYKGKINVSVGDVTNIKAEDNTYDAVFDFFTLQHVKDWRRGLSEISRVLKLGGYFAFGELYGSTLNTYIRRHLITSPVGVRFERGDWVKALAENRLRLMERKRKLLGYGFIGVARKS